jgi:hypothetical protein
MGGDAIQLCAIAAMMLHVKLHCPSLAMEQRMRTGHNSTPESLLSPKFEPPHASPTRLFSTLMIEYHALRFLHHAF